MVSKVIEGNYCVGCGACAAVAPASYAIGLDDSGFLQAHPTGDTGGDEEKASKVCPFSDQSANEHRLAAEFLPEANLAHKSVGRYIRCYAGRAADDSVYGKSSSGGIGRWFLSELLRRGLVDHVVHVVEDRPATSVPGSDSAPYPLYKFAISNTPDEVLATARSAYYPVELSGVARHIRENEGRYAITGVPCFIKAIRNIALLDADFRRRVKFTVGIVCGHLKSAAYAEMIGWQLGVEPRDLGALDFRVKIPGKKANEKGVAAAKVGTGSPYGEAKTVQQIFGTNYGYGYFKYNACDYCDDVLAETADISIGDAWLPEYMASGTSLVVARSPSVMEVLAAAEGEGRITLTEITSDRAAQSQDAGLRHRRDGLAYRLFLKKRQGMWAPRKRVAPSWRHLSPRVRRIMRLRLLLSRQSTPAFREAKRRNDWSFFEQTMSELNRRYEEAYRRFYLDDEMAKWWRRAKGLVKKLLTGK